MPGKRRISFSRYSDSTTMATSLLRKRKRPNQLSVTEMCQELYDVIKNHRNSDSRLICEAFVRLPKKRAAPDYYETIVNPIDLLRIQQKIKTEEYEDVNQLTSDMELMCSNAKTYYKKNSQEYKDAGELWEVFLRTRNGLLNENSDEYMEEYENQSTCMRYDESEDEDESNLAGEGINDYLDYDDNENGDVLMNEESLDKQYKEEVMSEGEAESAKKGVDDDELEEVFSVIMMAKDDDRLISTMFQLLPSKTKYSEYYDVIKEPIDLKMIAQKIQAKAYESLDDFEKDMMLLVKNAKIFNEPGSQIYKDAESLKKILKTKRLEIENRRNNAVKSSERLRSRDKPDLPKLSAVCAALQYQPNVETESNVSTMDDDDDSGDETQITEDKMLLWALYNTVLTYQSSTGHCLSERFMKLPNKRFHPDYYKEIKYPLSLLNVRKKLKHNGYSTLEQLLSDLNLVFDNAKQYNVDESLIFKNACILQNVARDKKKELESNEPKDSWDDDDSSGYRGKGRRRLYSQVDERRKTPGKRSAGEDFVRKRISELYRCVTDYVDETGRELKTIFVSLPSKKDYPDYYKVISEPIDLQVIGNKIRNYQYDGEAELISDFELMFNNARHYNEETSQVYKDADVLEQVLKLKYHSYQAKYSPAKNTSSLKQPKDMSLSSRLSVLLNSIKDYTDAHGRTLSTPFMKLPLKSDYPDYYEVIKKPIDLQRIQQKHSAGNYESLEDMVADIVQMFDNACKYNEPDSLIYKDALTLQRVCLEKKAEMSEEDADAVPDVKSMVQELMTNLFISVYNHQDEEGRCYSDSFSEIPLRHESDGDENVMTFDQVRWNLDKGRYRRMDRFQDDMFEVFLRIRRVSRSDSQAYEDAIELQLYYMEMRDELCHNGEILLTPALSVTEKHLMAAVDKEKKEKALQETVEDEKSRGDEVDKSSHIESVGDDVQSVKVSERVYTVGDFVYIQPRDLMLEPHIVHIERLFQDHNGEWNLFGYFYYRPNETFHVASRKFLEKEVFRSDGSTSVPLSQVLGVCCVMFVKDYFRFAPEGFDDKDVYVCESRYMLRHRLFKKIKQWVITVNDDVKIVPRLIPLVPNRVASVFADRSKSGEFTEQLRDGATTLLDKKREKVPVESPADDQQLTYFEQFCLPSDAYKIGDCVYVRSLDERPYIARIEKIWTDSEGNAFFYGPWFVRPDEVDHPPTRLFYHHEVFLSSIEDTNPLLSILGKCSVLYYKDYCSCRITEIPEEHVYICECKYQESERIMKRIGKGLKKFSLSPLVTDDEIYFFRRAINPRKEPSPLLIRASDNGFEAGQDLTFDITDALLDEYAPDPERAKRRKKNTNKKTLSGYIVFAGVTRRKIQLSNPKATFGDISRIVGQKWRALSKEEKEKFEEKAKKMIAEQQLAQSQEAESASADTSLLDGSCMSPGPSQDSFTPGTPYSHGYPYNSPRLMGLPMGHPRYQPSPAVMSNGILTPGHLGPPNGRLISRHGYGVTPGSLPPYPEGYVGPLNFPQQTPALPPNQYEYKAPARPPSPMFVSVPPKTQRLLHSEVYLKYIEGLRPDNNTVGNWDKSFTATIDNSTPGPDVKLPSHWLAQAPGYHDNVLQALWSLRDLMMRDTLNIVRTVPFDSL